MRRFTVTFLESTPVKTVCCTWGPLCEDDDGVMNGAEFDYLVLTKMLVCIGEALAEAIADKTQFMSMIPSEARKVKIYETIMRSLNLPLFAGGRRGSRTQFSEYSNPQNQYLIQFESVEHTGPVPNSDTPVKVVTLMKTTQGSGQMTGQMDP